MRSVGAALGHDVDVNAEVGAVLGGRAAGLHLDLRHGVRDRPHAGRSEKIRGGIDAVERQAVLNLTLAGAPEAQTDIAVEAAEDTRRRARQAPDVAAAQRQLDDRALADRFRDRGAVGVQHLRLRRHVHRFGDAADLERRVRAHDLVGRDLDAGRLERLKARDRDRDLIPAGAHERDVVVALGVRGRFVGILRAGVDRHDLGARHDEAAAVGNRPDQRGLGRELCRSIRCQNRLRTSDNAIRQVMPNSSLFDDRRQTDVWTLRVCRPDDNLPRYLLAPGAGISVHIGREMPFRSQTTCPPLTVSSHSSF